MKRSRFFLLLSMLLLTFTLSACGSVTTASSWPGLLVDGDTAYLAYNTHIYAINLANGTEKWRYPAAVEGQKVDPKKTFYATPTMTGDGKLVVGSFDHRLYKLDPATGQEIIAGWPFTQSTSRFVAGPLALDGEIIAPSADGQIYNVGSDGSLHWQYKTENSLWATPASDGEKVYVSSMDHRVYALQQESRELVWKTDDLGGSVVGTPTLSEDGSTLYVGTFGNALVAVDTGSGKVKGKFTTLGWVWSGPALSDGVLYFGDVEGNLYAVDAADLSQKWTIHPDAQPKLAIADQPLVVGDSLYVASESGNLYIVNKANGSVLNTIALGGERGKLNTSPVAADNLVLVAITGSENLLVALNKDGGQSWVFATPK